jgi:hypothetical protein
VWNADPQGNTSVTPAWRKTISHYVGASIGPWTQGDYQSEDWIKDGQKVSHSFDQLR